MSNKFKYWDVQKKDTNTILISLKDQKQILINEKLILVFYQLSIGGIIPLSPIKAKFFLSSKEVVQWWYMTHKRILSANEIDVDFNEHKVEFSNNTVIETNFVNGVFFEIKKDKDEKKLITLLENAYHTFFEKQKDN